MVAFRNMKFLLLLIFPVKSVKPMQFQVLKLGNNASSKKNAAVLELLHFRKIQSMWKFQDPLPLTMYFWSLTSST